jgi:hypothetical protein
MYQQKNNNENKKYNCQCGEAFVALKEYYKDNQYNFQKTMSI